MRPNKPRTTGEGDLFRARLDQIINMKHELVQLVARIDWDWIDREVAPLYSDNGRPGIATRFVIGLLLLKHIYGLSDEGVCERWVYDPYFQHFTGEEFFQHQFPHERSDLSHWRKRLGTKLELLLAESLRVAHATGALRTRDIKRVTVDTTVQPKAITFPTDAKLLHAAIKGLNRLADKCGLQLRQSYLRIAKRAAMMAGRYAHAKQFQRHHRQLRLLRTRLGRLIRISAARSPGRPISRPYWNGRWRAPSKSVPSSSASAGGSSIPSTRPRSNASARAKPARPMSSGSKPRSSPPMPALPAANLCSTPRRCRAIPTTDIRSAASSTPLRSSPAAQSSAPMATRAIAATTPPIRTASSSPARNAASLASSNASCVAAPPSRP